jgi:hypothetical protein
MTAYSLIKYPLEDIKWFFDQLVAAGGNATEALFVTTWDDTWEWQPYTIKRRETKMWKDKPWNPYPGYEYPVFGLGSWNPEAWAKWREIFNHAASLDLTLIIRVQDFCSRKDNFLERHWCYWSCVQSWRWGGRMSGGYLHWPIGDGGDGKYIWPHYDKINKRLIAELKASGVEYYLEDWNELHFTKGSQHPTDAPQDDAVFENEVHKWFIGNFKSHGCPADRIICNPQRGKRESASYMLQVQRLRAAGAIIEHHGCASPKVMRDIISIYGANRNVFPNGDGMDQYAKGINDGRKYYTEPSYAQAVTMGKLLKQNNLLGYLYKGRRFRKTQDLRKADFTAVRGLAAGLKNG